MASTGFDYPSDVLAKHVKLMLPTNQSMVLVGSRRPPRSLHCRDHRVMASHTNLRMGLTPTRLTSETPGSEPAIGRSSTRPG
jgi:hypothetical protein